MVSVSVIVTNSAKIFIPVMGHILLEESHKIFEKFVAVLPKFIAKLATGNDDTPVWVVAYACGYIYPNLPYEY